MTPDEALQAAALGAASGPGGNPPLHHELQVTFEPDVEPTAKRLVWELSERLGVEISDVRNLEYEQIWEDLTSGA